ncbi:DNA polymerase III subunit alpha [Lacticaseibacillus nasuensis]|uniref:DNA polymerase III subunit alpha n=1 Tax=Lacticaseibacillus nasuensis JCM 17158 TaxID=1291734 RepID=A0A0R1JXN5_9LACO|nr:DNA polymerase III subunit alpha [Lacticaseibacillus nasuensis]KRK73268.1 dna polymerase iii dnae [Lacticaseibacillus nasuensis JCM 17158]
MTFIQLQVQSAFSLLQSPLTVAQIVAAAKDRGYTAIALTDTNVMYGSVDFYRQAQAAGIKPLIGLQLAVADATVVLIAETTAGYHQLLRLSSAVKLAETLPSLAELPDFTEIAAIVPGETLLGESAQPAETQLAALAAKHPASLAIGITADSVNTALPRFAQDAGVALMALGAVSYQDPTDAFTQTVLQAIGAGTQLNCRDPTLMDPGTHWLMPPEQAAAPFEAAGLAQAVAATAALAARAEVTIEFKQPQLPHFATPNQQPAKDYLRQLATAGLTRRFSDGVVPAAYSERLDYELGVIDKMGFADYFLVVWDVMNHAHEVGIMTGPGRGSAAGALVSYALAITEVDPIAYHLLFERFLNPARANMPDIDLDIPDNRRSELIQYVHERYGDDHMAQIITFGTFGAKQALRDVARVFGLSQFDAAKWSNAIPNDFHIDLRTAYSRSQALKNLVADSEQNAALFNTALAIEGLPRHDSTHAAGIVLAQEPLTDTVALQTGGDGIAQTQVPMGDIEALGLLKMDFLGLRNLSILASACEAVTRITGKPFDPKQIPLDDAATLKLFARGDTNGVFQFESNGIRRVLRQLQPTTFEDVVAVNALYRPGPMENIDTFIARKNGREPITYPAPALEPILKPTYGVLVYQEQVMQVASAMGGFSLGEADLLRRAMSKKKAAVLAAEREKFIAGAKAKGYSADTAETVYAYIDRFANYGFNRSHAVAYSMVAFWLAYLKEHYPAAFFTALMNASLNNTAKLRVYLQEARHRKLTVLGPDINASAWTFTLSHGAIRFGFMSVKGMRRDFVEAVLTARQAGPFKSLRDVLQRLDVKWLKPDHFLPLIDAGAFDSFSQNRAATTAGLDELIESVRLAGNDVELFSVLQPKPVAIPDYGATERLDREAAVLGVYLSGHPVDRYVAALRPYQPVTAVADLVVPQTTTVVLVIRRIKRIRTKKGQEMGFIDGQDATGSLSVTVFPQQYPQVKALADNTVIVVTGRTEAKNGLQLIATKVTTGEAALAALPAGQLFLQLPAAFTDSAALLKTLAANRGDIPVITVNAVNHESVLLARQYWVTQSPALTAQLTALIGAANVAYRPRAGAKQNS